MILITHIHYTVLLKVSLFGRTVGSGKVWSPLSAINKVANLKRVNMGAAVNEFGLRGKHWLSNSLPR